MKSGWSIPEVEKVYKIAVSTLRHRVEAAVTVLAIFIPYQERELDKYVLRLAELLLFLWHNTYIASPSCILFHRKISLPKQAFTLWMGI
jgi:hypothetical protein